MKRWAFAVCIVLACASLALPSGAATTPVDVSGPLDGDGPGVALSPPAISVGGNAGLVAQNLPTADEAAAWVDDGDFSGETGTYSGPVTIALCGNADATGTPLAPGAFDPAIHCDGGDARSASQLIHATASNGGLLVPVSPRVGIGTFEWDDDGNPLTPPIEAPMGIGTALATCVPAASPCRYVVRDATGSVFVGTAEFQVVAPPSVGITSITGQAPGALAARAGDTVNVAGTNWQPEAGLLVQFCDALAPDDCDPSSTTVGLHIDTNGVLTGSVPVDALNTPGARVLKITQTIDNKSALASIDILAPREITIGPSTGGPGTAVTVNGTGFDPLQPVTLVGHDGANPTSDVGAATVDARGVLTGSIVVNSPGTLSIVAREDDAPETQRASAPFSFNSAIQTIDLEINTGALSLAQDTPLVDMQPIQLTGLPQTAQGRLEPVTIIDNRGTLVGWTLTGTMTDFVDRAEQDKEHPAANHFIPAGNMTWTPSCGPAPGTDGTPEQVVAGPVATLDPNVAATLCSAPPGGGGGRWVASADLSLQVPASIAAGDFRAVLTLVVT